MDLKTLEEVLACLDEDRRLFFYFEEQYAVYMLSKLIGEKQHLAISQIRQHCLAKLLNKPRVKSIIRHCGDGVLTHERLESFIADSYKTFVVTLAHWGHCDSYNWSQTSRPGVNLVLQFNLTNEHDQMVRNIGLDTELFKRWGHPIHQQKSSIAWSRIDFDLESGKALIEEIQTDWIRIASYHHRVAVCAQKNGNEQYRYGGAYYETEKTLRYTNQFLATYGKCWSEVVLGYSIQFIADELGIKDVYYHDYETGAVLKNLRSSRPPKSLYTELPKKFCFSQTSEGPSFVIQDKRAKRRYKKIKSPMWWHLKVA
ncbi:hypothetical protein FLL45_06170 [Aliikangiella marina]|uniref:Uncharacterized protein n=1 Tax=Aliikangiella marina TaxID=1712262 RepID=A0A545TK12_9GAMM|nr:hypothetical protein [Aliikangiella marina]TQV77526.1 hypothetical protein FLL45_06170 [Aliikangiella marina]